MQAQLLTPAQAANALALQNAMLWFGAAGAGAAELAMLLKGRARTHRALACVALASAVAIHCVVTWLLGVNLVTAPTGLEGQPPRRQRHVGRRLHLLRRG